MIAACHKQCDVPKDAMYMPIQVGAIGKKSIGFQRDDEGDNISFLNPKYCELTGLYWAWKNTSYDYLGLSHYRRYFSLHSKKNDLNTVLSLNEAEKLLNQYRIIVPKKRKYFIETLYTHYSHTFDGTQLDKVRKILVKFYPEYTESYDAVMKHTYGYMFNMFIMPKDLCNEYFTWLFDVLGELDKMVDSSAMSPFEERYLGRISERLFNVWLYNLQKTGRINGKDIHEIPIMYLGNINWPKKIVGFISAKLFQKKYKKSF